MKLKNISFFFIMVFSVFGFVVFSYLIHELSHWQDFKEIATDDRICFRVDNFTFGSDGASYWFVPVKGSEEELDRIDRFTEYKAYAVSGVSLVFFCVFFCSVLWAWLMKEFA